MILKDLDVSSNTNIMASLDGVVCDPVASFEPKLNTLVFNVLYAIKAMLSVQ